MAVGLLKEGIRAQLDWLEYTEVERQNLEQLYVQLLFTWMSGLPEGKAVDAVYASHEITPYSEELSLEKFFSREDLEAVATGVHPYYNFDGSETERIEQFMKELIDSKVAPAAIYNYWQDLLEEFEGDEFQALVELPFRRPLEAS